LDRAPHPELIEAIGHDEALFARIRRNLVASGIPVESIKAEYSEGQFELVISSTDALRAADDHAVYKLAIREMARSAGLAATFMAKWDEAHGGSSCHLHISLRDDDGRNVFSEGDTRAYTYNGPPTMPIGLRLRTPGRRQVHRTAQRHHTHQRRGLALGGSQRLHSMRWRRPDTRLHLSLRPRSRYRPRTAATELVDAVSSEPLPARVERVADQAICPSPAAAASAMRAPACCGASPARPDTPGPIHRHDQVVEHRHQPGPEAAVASSRRRVGRSVSVQRSQSCPPRAGAESGRSRTRA